MLCPNWGFRASTCSSCHSNKDVVKANTEAKAWPMSLSYNATAFGAFPFWDNTGPGCTYCNPAVDNAARLSVIYDADLNSELLMHGNFDIILDQLPRIFSAPHHLARAV